MSAQFTREQLKLCVAKMCPAIGWHTSTTTPIEILTDILYNYLFQLGRTTKEYANGFGMTEPNLDHLGLAFRDFNVKLSELEEYVKYVDFMEPPASVPKYPLPKEDHLNFLKPGSKEVVTRQVHIHEHLPPMHPVFEVNESKTETNVKREKAENSNLVFKRPAEISQGEVFKRPRLLLEEEGWPAREISSVMMTTSGFLSPAREGKLPESRTPIAPPPTIPAVQLESNVNKKRMKVMKKVEKKKNKVGKTEKLNTSITPLPQKTVIPLAPPTKIESHVDKLFTELDKRKLNILKKISVKNEKQKIIKDEIKQESRESSPGLIIDESANEISNKVHHLSSDITMELHNSVPPTKSHEKFECTNFIDDSPPGTPITPEMISQSPPLNRGEKRKRKDKSKVKKMQKRARLDPEAIDIDMECPKTPEAYLVIKQEKQELPVTPSIPFPFFSSFAGPGLIPPMLNNPLFPHLQIPPVGIPNIPSFGQPPVCTGMSMNFMQPLKQEIIKKSKSPPVEKVAPVINLRTTTEKNVPSPKREKKSKEHKKDKKDKLNKKNKKDKIKNKAEKKKLKEEKKDKEKIKKEKKEKRKDKEIRDGEILVPKLTLKLGSASPHPESPYTRKLNIKPIIKKEEESIAIAEPKREMSPEQAKISALVTGQSKPKTTCTMTLKDETVKKEVAPTRTLPSPGAGPRPGRPIKPKPTKPNKQQQQTLVKDAEGNKVWICPACEKQDDGSPMIGCDDCDAWYHWVCVGIQVPPDDTEDWYCRLCISKKQEVLQTDKKKKRKKREKK